MSRTIAIRSATKPLLVATATKPIPGSTPDYERGWRVGAICVRRDQADECRRLACDAHLSGDDGRAFKLHGEADLAEARIMKLSREIGEFKS